MKRFLEARAAGLLAAGIFASAIGAAGAPAPRIVCDEPVYRFGALADGVAEIEHMFVLRNAGEVDLEISDVDVHCGCTDLRLSHRILPPGASAQLRVRLSLRGRSGSVDRFLLVHSNDPRQPVFRLAFEGGVRPEVGIEPAAALFGAVNPAAAAEFAVTVRLAGATPRVVRGARPTTEAFAARVETVAPGREYRVLIRPTAALAQARGLVCDPIRIELEPPAAAPVSVVAAALPLSRVTVAPAELLLPAQAEAPLTRYAVVRAPAGWPVRILRVEPPDPAVRVTLQPLPGGASGWQIRLDGLPPGDRLAGRRLTIVTDLPEDGVFEIPVRPVPVTPR